MVRVEVRVRIRVRVRVRVRVRIRVRVRVRVRVRGTLRRCVFVFQRLLHSSPLSPCPFTREWSALRPGFGLLGLGKRSRIFKVRFKVS